MGDLKRSGGEPKIFQGGGGGVEEENLERKMFVDTRNNACLHKKLDKHATLSLFFSFQEDCLLFFCFYLLK